MSVTRHSGSSGRLMDNRKFFVEQLESAREGCPQAL